MIMVGCTFGRFDKNPMIRSFGLVSTSSSAVSTVLQTLFQPAFNEKLHRQTMNAIHTNFCRINNHLEALTVSYWRCGIFCFTNLSVGLRNGVSSCYSQRFASTGNEGNDVKSFESKDATSAFSAEHFTKVNIYDGQIKFWLGALQSEKLQSGRELLQTSAAADARGIKDPIIWMELAKKAIRLLNRSQQGNLLWETQPQYDSATEEQANGELGSSQTFEGADSPSSQQDSSPVRNFRFFEVLEFAGHLRSAGYVDSELLVAMEPLLMKNQGQMDTRHLLQLFNLYETCKIRLRGLYSHSFRSLVRLGPNMTADDLADVLSCFARLRMGSSLVIDVLIKCCIRQLHNSSLCCCSRTLGALTTLGVAQKNIAGSSCNGLTAVGSIGTANDSPSTPAQWIKRRAKLLMEALPVEILLQEIKMMANLEFSWRSIEKMAYDEFIKRISAMQNTSDIDELVSPFSCLLYLKRKNAVPNSFLHALSRWCRDAVHRPPTRSQKRPTAEDLLILHDMMKQRSLEDDESLHQSLRVFVATEGGMKRSTRRVVSPISYQNNRRYFYLPDTRHGQRPLMKDRPISPVPSEPKANAGKKNNTLFKEQTASNPAVRPLVTKPVTDPERVKVVETFLNRQKLAVVR